MPRDVNHDPLCPQFDPMDAGFCRCDLIARVRLYERAACAGVVADIGAPRSPRTGLRPVYAEIVAAIMARGGDA